MKKSRSNHLLVPLESLRMSLWIPLCPDLRNLYDTFGFCPTHLQPVGWSYLVCFIYLCRLARVSLTHGMFSPVIWDINIEQLRHFAIGISLVLCEDIFEEYSLCWILWKPVEIVNAWIGFILSRHTLSYPKSGVFLTWRTSTMPTDRSHSSQRRLEALYIDDKESFWALDR